MAKLKKEHIQSFFDYWRLYKEGKFTKNHSSTKLLKENKILFNIDCVAHNKIIENGLSEKHEKKSYYHGLI